MRVLPPLVALLIAAPLFAGEQPAPKYKRGDSLADVVLTKVDEKPVKLSAYTGKTLVLVFLGSFSKTAKEVARDVEKKLKPRLPTGVVVAYVHVEPVVAAATFRKERDLTGETWVDPKATLLTELGHKSVPAVAVIDGKSRLQFTELSFSRAKLETKIRQVAGEGAKA